MTRRRPPARSLAAGALAASALLWLASCGPKTRTLEEGSRAPDSPRVSSSATFQPKVGDFTTIEILEVAPAQMSAAATELVGGTLPVIRERGGLRDVWMMRDQTNSRFVIVSVWADPVAFQQWQISEQRLAAYQKLGPFLVSQPATQPVSLIGLIAPRRP